MFNRVCNRAVCSTLSLCLFGCAACHSSRAPLIAVIPETTAQELWESEHAGVESEARRWGWRVYWNAPSREDDIARQIQIVNQEIGREVDGLVLSPDHANALIAPVRRALANRIPTVILGSRLDIQPDSRLHLVLNDEEADGRLAAHRAELYLRPSSTIAVLGVDPNLAGSVERADALERDIRARFPDAHVIVRRLTNFDFAQAEEVAEEVIHSQAGLTVIVSLTVVQTRGAYQALLDTQTVRRIKLIGCDQDLDLLHHLRTGGIDALIAENTYQMGADAMEIIHRVKNGQTVANEVVQPILITREDVDAGSVQQVLSMDWTAKQDTP